MHLSALQLQNKFLRNVEQRQHLSAVKNRKLCGAALAQKGELCGRVRRKLSNYAAKLRRNFHKSAVIVRHLKLIFWVLLASAL